MVSQVSQKEWVTDDLVKGQNNLAIFKHICDSKPHTIHCGISWRIIPDCEFKVEKKGKRLIWTICSIDGTDGVVSNIINFRVKL